MISKVSMSNRLTFCAINQKFLNEAKSEHKIMNTVSGDLIEKLQHSILTKKITPQGGLDTVIAIKPYTKKKYHKFLEPIIEMCNKKMNK